MTKFIVTGVAGLVFLVLGLLIGFLPRPVKVSQGYTLVVAYNLGSQKGKVTERTAGVEWLRHFYTDSFKMPNSIQEDSYKPFWVVSADNQRLPVQLTLKYRVNDMTGCGSQLYRDYRKDIDRIIATDLYSSTVDMSYRVFSNYNADEIFGNKISQIADSLTAQAQRGRLVSTRNADGHLCLLVEQIKIRDVDADSSIKSAVANKIVRDQEVQEEQAKTMIVLEQLKQDSARAVIAASANREIQETLTPEVLKRMELDNQRIALEKWNGVLPTYTGGGTVPFLSLN